MGVRIKHAGFAAILIAASFACHQKTCAQYYDIALPKLNNELALSYSYAPSYDSWPGLQHLLSKEYMFEQEKFLGSLTLAFRTKINPVLSFTGSVAVTSFRGVWFTQQNAARRDMSNTLTSAMIGLKYFWLDKDMFQIYSRGDVGATFASSRRTLADGSSTTDKTNSFALNISPIGFQYGYSFAVFAELSVGSFGYITAGVAYRW